MRLLGRNRELADLRGFLHHAPSGDADAVLMLSGEPGIGKSALLHQAVTGFRADGGRVLRGQGCESESRLVFSGLHELLAPALDVLDRLPGHLSAALETALGRRVATARPDELHVRIAALETVRALSAAEPLLLAVDDVDLLDTGSLEVLFFVARRLRDTSIRMLLASGRGIPHESGPDLPVLTVGPLCPRSAAQLVEHLFPALPERARLETLRRGAGNPAALVELGHAAGTAVATPVTRASGSFDALSRRIRSLPARTRQALLYAAVADPLDPSAALSTAGIPAGAWVPAEKQRLVLTRAGRVTFGHTLARVAAEHGATAEERRRAHGALAAAQPEGSPCRAWHRLQAGSGTDEDAASEVERATGRILRDSGAYVATRALERAAECSADPAARRRRYAAALVLADRFGAPAWVRQLHDRLGEPDPADVSLALARAASRLGHQRDGARLLHHTLRQGPADPELLALLGTVAYLSGDDAHRHAVGTLLPRVAATTPRDTAFRALAEASTDPARATALLVSLTPDSCPGTETTEAAIARNLCVAGIAQFADAPEVLLGHIRPAIAALRATDSLGAAADLTVPMITALLDTGRWSEAESALTEWTGIAQVRRLRTTAAGLAAARASLLSWRALPHEASACLAEAGELVDPAENAATTVLLRTAAARVATAGGDLDGAWRQLRGVFTAEGEPRHYFLSPRAIAELAAAARTAEQRADAARVLTRTRAGTGPAPTARMRLLLHHAQALVGSPAGTERQFRLATECTSGERWPREQALARLHFAEWLRRQRRALEARPLLEAAIEVFDHLGMCASAARARIELRAAGGAPAPGGVVPPAPPATTAHPDRLGQLTAQQREIVLLAAGGLRNREIGTALHLSPRTVGSHLHNAYRKLGVSGRHQLPGIVGSPERD